MTYIEYDYYNLCEMMVDNDATIETVKARFISKNVYVSFEKFAPWIKGMKWPSDQYSNAVACLNAVVEAGRMNDNSRVLYMVEIAKQGLLNA